MISGNPPHHSQNDDEPVTIDLHANETDREAPAYAAAEPAQAEPIDEGAQSSPEPEREAASHRTSTDTAAPQPANSGHSTSTLIAAGIVGGLIALVCAGAVQYAGLLPAPSASKAGNQEISSLNDQVEALKQSVATLSAAPAAKPDPSLEKRIAALEANGASANGAAGTDAASSRKIAELSAEVDQLKANISQTTQAQASSGADLNKRLDDAEKKLNEPGKDVAVAQAIAAAGLKAAIDRGGPFRAELDTFSGVAPNDPAVAALKSFADTGVPSRAELIRQVPDVVNSIISATQQPDENQSWSDRLLSSAKSLVTVRPVGDVPGDGVDAIAARFENKIRNGDLPGAVTEWNSLPDAGKSASAAFKQSIEARIHVEDLVGDTLSKAIAGAGKQS